MRGKKGVVLDVRVWDESERRVGNCNQDILYEKESIFSKKKTTKNFCLKRKYCKTMHQYLENECGICSKMKPIDKRMRDIGKKKKEDG